MDKPSINGICCSSSSLVRSAFSSVLLYPFAGSAIYAGPLEYPPFDHRRGNLFGCVFIHRKSSSDFPRLVFFCFLPDRSNESFVVLVTLASMFDRKLYLVKLLEGAIPSCVR